MIDPSEHVLSDIKAAGEAQRLIEEAAMICALYNLHLDTIISSVVDRKENDGE